MTVLGIETSCDETSVALFSDGNLLSNLVSSQDFHIDFGGVVPELSSRAHLQILLPLIKEALKRSQLEIDRIDLICSTAGPGLIGALLVGYNFGRALAFSLQKPFIPVNHIEGHIYSGFLMSEKPVYPYLCLVVSGGHTLLLLVKSESEIKKLGTTKDDAVGEAFDKVAKLLGLGYPGGPQIEKYAAKGDKGKIKFPIARLEKKMDFSFSGLKTAVLRYVQQNYVSSENIPPADLPDIAASFQEAAVRALINNMKIALTDISVNSISIVGGVAANGYLRSEVQTLSKNFNTKLVIPDLVYCGDNAAMIASRGQMLYDSGNSNLLRCKAFPSLRDDPNRSF